METQSHFQRQIQELKEDLLGMAGLVEAAIQDAFGSLVNRNSQQSKSVIDGDRRIDLIENEIDEKAITLLATQQPVASDLRFLASTLRIVSFLERMGDQAVNLAWRAITISEMDRTEIPDTLMQTFEIARDMTRGCLDAYAHKSVDQAKAVITRDDELDLLTRQFLEESIRWMNEENRLARRGVELILASRHLERIGDEATNIAEEVVYWIEGEIIRHRGEE